MSKRTQELTKQNLKYVNTDKLKFNKSIILGSIFATIIAITPFIYYTYEYVPETKTWETWFFTYESGFYEDAQVGIWSILMKAVPVLLLFIWFFTCRHWWYHALLVPIAMFTYQIFGALNDDMEYIDEFQLIHLVPVMTIVIPSIYLMRSHMFNTLNTINKTTQELEDELMFKPKTIWGKIKQYF